jgi:hypothetical protein
MDTPIKRIELTVTPNKPGLPWDDFADYIIDSYDTGAYEFSTSEGDDLRYVFYGRDAAAVVRWFREQVGSDGTAFPATLAVEVTPLSIVQWKALPVERRLDPDFFTSATSEGDEQQ